MFKEAYQKDNEMIKPDAEFIEHLKETIAKEQGEVQLGKGKAKVSEYKAHTTYVYRFAVTAACLLLVIGVAVFRNDIWDSVNRKDGGLKTKAVLKQTSEKEENMSAAGEQYVDFMEFIRQEVVFYKLQDAVEDRADGQELIVKEAEELKNDILSERYTVVIDEKELNAPIYYVVANPEGDEIRFALDGDGHIWILKK